MEHEWIEEEGVAITGKREISPNHSDKEDNDEVLLRNHNFSQKRLKMGQDHTCKLHSAMEIASLADKGVSVTPTKLRGIENKAYYLITPPTVPPTCTDQPLSDGTYIISSKVKLEQTFCSSSKSLKQQWWKKSQPILTKRCQEYEECNNWKWCPEKISSQRPVYCRICDEGINNISFITECAFCEKPCCSSKTHDCSDECCLCRKYFCRFCLTRNYDEAIVRSLCLDCERSERYKKVNENDMEIG